MTRTRTLWSGAHGLDEGTAQAIVEQGNINAWGDFLRKLKAEVMLVHTQLTGFELVRRLMLEASYPAPCHFANGWLLDSDFSRLTQLAKQIVDSPFHLWEPMEHTSEELYEWLALVCDETGAKTVVVDTPSMFSGMSGNQSWVKLANHLKVEMMLYRPIATASSLEI